MGYTHYFKINKKLNQNKWEDFVSECLLLYNNLPKYSKSSGSYYEDDKLLIGNWCGVDKPIFNSNEIIFNGKGETFDGECLDCETFIIRKNNIGFNSCKTDRKPYDLLVQLSLISMCNIFKNEVGIMSDGNFDCWKQSLELYYKITNKLPNKKIFKYFKIPDYFYRKHKIIKLLQ